MRFSGKKLLMLGTSVASVDIVKYARENGAYVIVTDYLSTEKSAAKQIADETAMVSTIDIDAVYELAKEKEVDGIFCGVSEANLVTVQAVCERLNLPCYFTADQWNILQNKKAFKKSCIDNGISTPKEYLLTDHDIRFPVIVKPAVGSSSKGISICHNRYELTKAVKIAEGISASKKCVIEEYIEKDEVMVFYTIANGEVALSAMCDRYMKHFDNSTTQLPIGYRYPSKHLKTYLSNFDWKVRNYIKNIGIKNGLLAFQAFIDKESFIPFDPTYRLDGTITYHFVEHENGLNAMKQLVNYSLLGTMGDEKQIIAKENPWFSSVCFELPVLLRKGVITRIEGIETLDYLKSIGDIICYNSLKKVGDHLSENWHFTQMLCRVLISAESVDKVRQVVSKINQHLKVFDENGNRMDWKMDESCIT